MKEIYKNLIVTWRKAYDKLTAEEKSGIQYIEDLRPPCQIWVVILENRALGVTEQTWIVSHFKDEPDIDIEVIGPIDSVEASVKFLEVAKAKRFERPLPAKTWFPSAKSYHDLIESHLLGLIESFRDAALQKIWTMQVPKSMFSEKRLLSEEVSVWGFKGILEQEAINSIVDSLIESVRSNARQKVQDRAPAEAQKRKEVRAMGTYIYPHIWVGSRPLHTFEEDMKNKMYGRERLIFHRDETFVFEKVGGFFWLATREGFIAITMEDASSALRLLNAFMSLLIMRGTPAFAIRDNELAQLTVDPDTGQVLSSQASIIVPRMLPRDMSFVRPRWQEQLMPVIEVSLIKQIWTDISQIANDNSALNTLNMFGEVYTHFQRDEYSQTVLLAWAMVETWFASTQDKVSRLEKLTEKHGSTRWKDLFELLETESAISSDMVSKLYQLRLLRNQISHSIGNATKEDAKVALETVAAIMQSWKG